MKFLFTDAHLAEPFQYGTWARAKPADAVFRHTGTLFIGEPGVALGKLCELRLREGKWVQSPIVSGGEVTNIAGASVFIQINDHMNASDFFIDTSHLVGVERVGTPIKMDVFLGGEFVKSITLGYISGVTTVGVPFFNPPTNPNQQTVLFLNNFQNDNVVRFIAVDAKGEVFNGLYPHVIKSGEQVLVVSDELYRIVGASPVDGNKLRLIICSSAPLTVVAKVRDSKTGVITDNASYVI
jgi:hypothetical protein